ncbi:hypothetical protein BDP27DRAFT_1335501 [Rhodocollybia butyracea]|uniref:Uncharacterized protein n=1 Tax=Rhodocollybia butyracea TaxID=206335 RepID=A0A9P5PDI4_9AGAR|nr:hypothetical protein BDP27DRAFT_1335501 [Rhodocollybia butyracea]
MPAHKPHSPSYSLNDLVLVMAFVEFVLSMAAAVLMRYHNGIVNDIICVFGIAAMICLPLDARGSVRLHEKLREREVRWATSSSGNPSRPVDVATTRKGQDGHPSVDQNVIAADPMTTTNTNTPSSIHIHSTYSSTSFSASNESQVSSQVEKSKARRQNQASVPVTRGNSVELYIQQLALALTQEKMKTNAVSLSRYIRRSTVPPLSDASLPAEIKGKNEEPVALRPVVVDSDIGTDIRGHTSSSMEKTAPGPTRTGLNTSVGEHNNRIGFGQWRTITDDDPLTTGAISLVLAARSTSSGVPDALLPDNYEGNQILHSTTKEGDEAGMQEASQGGLENVVAGSRCYETVAHAPLTKTNTDEIGDSPSPIFNDNASATNAISAIHVASSALLDAPGSSALLQGEVTRADKGMRPNTEGDGAGKQEHVETIPSGKLDGAAAGQCEEQIVLIHGGLMRRSAGDTTPSTAGWMYPLRLTKVKKEETCGVTPDEE